MTKSNPSQPHSDLEAPTSPVKRGTGANSSFMVAPVGSENLPATIGRYRVLKELGRGGMGVVYLAKRAEDVVSQPLAIKVLKRGLDTEQVLKRFNLERQLLGAMNHPHIARLFDADSTEDGRPFLVMEYVEGEAIDKYCFNNRLTVPQRLRLFQKVCSAVHALHQNLIVHRDLKPGNIIVNAQGEPKILDLGIAKLINPTFGGLADQTIGETQLMTPEYASPEQVAGRPITTASDIYSLGMVLYELLTGERAYSFQTRSSDEIRRLVCEIDPERPSTRVSRTVGVGNTTAMTIAPVGRLQRTLEGDLDDIVLMALEKVPARRYPSAQDLSQDIERHLTDEPVKARRTSQRRLYFATKFFHRNRKAVSAAAAGVVVLTGAFAVAAYGWNSADRERRVAADEKRSAEAARQLAEENEQRAVSEKQRADESFRRSLALVNDLLLRTFNDVSRLEEPTDSMASILEDAAKFIRSQPPEYQNDPEVKKSVAELHEKMGTLQFSRDNPHVGKPSEAILNYRASIQGRRELLIDTPENKELRHGVWQSNRFAGQAAAAMGRTDEALTHLRSALEQSGVQSREGDAPTLNRVRTLLTLGGALRDAWRWKEAVAASEESLRLREQEAARSGDAQPSRPLSTGYANVGEVLLDAGRAAEAVEPLRRNLEMKRALAAQAPAANARTRRDTANAELLLGTALVRSGRADEGMPLLRSACSALDSAPDAESARKTRNARAIMDRAEFASVLGAASAALGQKKEAQAQFEAQVAAAEQLIGVDASNAWARLMLARGQRALSSLLRDSDRPKADELLNAAVDGLRALVKDAPEYQRAKGELAFALADWAEANKAAQAEEAGRRSNEALQLALNLQNIDGSHAEMGELVRRLAATPR